MHKNFFRWYVRFIRNYITWKQIVGMAILFNVRLHLFHIPIPNLLLFWVAPSLLSTLQLFYFGTMLPHRRINFIQSIPNADLRGVHTSIFVVDISVIFL